MNFEVSKMKRSQPIREGLLTAELYQGLDLRALIGTTKEPVLSIQEQIELAIQGERKKIQEEKSLLKQTQELLLQTIEAVENEKKEFLAKIHDELLEVVVEVVKNIIDVELSTNKEIIKNCFTKIVKQIEDEDVQKIIIHEEDLNILKTECATTLQKISDSGKYEIISRTDIPRGSIRAESKWLKMDSSILEKMKRFISETIGSK
ncbi:MAG: hypothetical protein ACD_73C00593G0003 [uncultured bacterium]|nr:MAG: hypothetical protein ACD_73C00593G0003 [uncultured bacterium]